MAHETDPGLPEVFRLQGWVLGTLLTNTPASCQVDEIYDRAGSNFAYFRAPDHLPFFWYLAILPLRDEGMVRFATGGSIGASSLTITPRGRRYYVALRGLANGVRARYRA